MNLDEVPKEILDEASKPVFERIARDAASVPEPLRSMVSWVGEHLFSPELKVETLLAGAGVAGNSAKMRFRKALRLPPRDYIEECRLEVAIRLLQLAPQSTNRQLAHSLGFASEGTFLLAFKRAFGLTPGEARRRLAGDSPVAAGLDPASLRQEVWERAMEGELSPAELERLRDELAAQGAKSVRLPDKTVSKESPTEDLDHAFFEEVLWERLRNASEAERREILWSGFPFRTTALFRGLLKSSRDARRDDARLGVEIAELALDALWALRDHLDARELARLRTEGLAGLGMARLLAGDAEGAEQALQQAEREQAEAPSGEPPGTSPHLNPGDR